MKERPILMSPPMVQAILAGTKTQTRRVVRRYRAVRYAVVTEDLCPYGAPGDRLWVKERHSFMHQFTSMSGHVPPRPGFQVEVEYSDGDKDYHFSEERQKLRPIGSASWRAAIFMPRWASRITIELTSVRCGMLQDISEEDARDEGCIGVFRDHNGTYLETPRLEYRRLWDQINGNRAPWDTNPFVWVLSFVRVKR
jgi:hypothetical protein